MNTNTKAEQFCHTILGSGINDAKALVNIVLALGGERTATNPTNLSCSPFFQYHYSMLGKVMKNLGEHLNGKQGSKLRSELQKLFLNYLPSQREYRLSTDFTTIRKPESPTLEKRGYVNIPNVRIRGNKAIDIGYYISCINLHLYDEFHPESWSIPLDNLRVDIDSSKISVALQQLQSLLRQVDLPFSSSDKVINTADTGYTIPSFISPLITEFDNLLLLNRIRYGSKVYKPYSGEQKARGRDKVYEEIPYYLQIEQERMFTHPKTKKPILKQQRPIFDLPVDDEVKYETIFANGRQVTVCIWRWNNLLIRGKDKHRMDNKPFDLVGVRYLDSQTQLL